MSEPDDFTPWTPQGAEQLRAAAAAFAAAITAHTEAIIARGPEEGARAVLEETDALLPVVMGYVDAQFSYTGTGFPFGVLHQYLDEEDGGEPGADEREEDAPVAAISVLQRQDYAVTDEDAVLAAGRHAFAELHPEAGAQAAVTDVDHLGRALYQVAHLDGWDSLGALEGLRPTGGTVVVLRQDEPLGPDPDAWPADPFDAGGELVYGQSDVYPG